MARPRIFISSTYYDLKHVRSSLEQFVDLLGYDAVLSEKGDVPYTSDVALDASCYREVQNSDVYVLIIGGRYGSETSQTRGTTEKEFFDKYESITKHEYKSARDNDIPVYILIERSVHAEYLTFRKNRDKTDITYAHVDSVNVFHFIEEILVQPKNNPVHQFDRYADIEFWLREQWAGLFRELIRRKSGQQQITSLAAQVSELAAVTTTLKRYMEQLVRQMSPRDASKIIGEETARLEVARRRSAANNPFVRWLERLADIPSGDIISLVENATGFAALAEAVSKIVPPERQRMISRTIQQNHSAQRDANSLRKRLGLTPFPIADETSSANIIDDDVADSSDSSEDAPDDQPSAE